MRTWILALLCCAAISVAAVRSQRDYKIVVQVSGVCNPDPYGIKCFTPAGTVDLQLTKEIRNFFEEHPEHPLRLLYGHRDKLIVVRHNKQQDLDIGASHRFSLSDGTPFPGVINMARKPTDDFATQLYWYYPSAKQTTVSVSYLCSTVLPTVTLPARVGAVSSFGPYTMTIAAIDRLRQPQAPHSGHFAERPMWIIEYRLSGPVEAKSTFSATAELVANSGRVIRAVNHAGRPSDSAADTPAQGVELAVPLHRGWATWVDPAETGQLVVTPTVTVSLTFPKIALGPY